MPDWFLDNAPKPTGGDWFASNAPKQETPTTLGEQPASLSGVARTMGKQALAAAPYAGAALGTLLAPEGMLPAIGGAILGGMSGKAAEQGISKVVGLPGAPASLNEATTNIGNAGLEQGAYELGGRVLAAPIAKAFGRFFKPEQWYQSALMPLPSSGKKAIERQVGLGIREGIPVSEAGAQMAQEGWRDLNREISNIIAQDPSKPMDPKLIVKSLDDLRDRWTRGSGDPAFADAIDSVKNNFMLRHPRLTGESAQEAKKGLYEEIRLAKQGAWKEGGGPNPLTVAAKQEIADSLRQGLEQIYPAIGAMNRNEGAYIELEKSLNRFTSREGNKRMTPYFAPLTAAASAVFGASEGHPGAGAAAAAAVMGAHFLRAAVEDPEVKSKIAIALAKAAKTGAVRLIGPALPLAAPNALRGAGYLMSPNPEEGMTGPGLTPP